MKRAELDAERLGQGPPVLFVHGSVVGARLTWRRQRELSSEWSLIFANRPGFGASAPLERGDFEREAPLFAELLGEGAHLVGHSYGAVIAMHVAALRPEAVLSLTVSEPGTLQLAGTPQAELMMAQGARLYAAAGEALSPREFIAYFRGGAGSTRDTPEELSEELLRGAEHAMRERPSWDGEVPLGSLTAAAFPSLVISGGHSEVFEAVCDSLAAALGSERERIEGKRHNVPETGAPYNERLARFLASCTPPTRPDRPREDRR